MKKLQRFKSYRWHKSSWPPNARWAAVNMVGRRSFQGWARWHHTPTCRSRLGQHSRVHQPSSRDSSGPAAAMRSDTHQKWCSGLRASVRTTPSPWRWRHCVDSVRETSPCCSIRSVALLTTQVASRSISELSSTLSFWAFLRVVSWEISRNVEYYSPYTIARKICISYIINAPSTNIAYLTFGEVS